MGAARSLAFTIVFGIGLALSQAFAWGPGIARVPGEALR